ncbi:MAG: twin-arginine translocase subunit TatC [Verrucomicrobia bacterium]|nr:twin-arginine translocase subunit TatC [Verrucomicrobiota bacterium]
MASEPEAHHAQVVGTEEEEEGFGGPVKTFLEHLEDLRWTLVKSVSAILLAMLVCLVAGNQLVKLLSWPLSHALTFGPKIRATPVQLGTNIIGRVKLGELGPLPWQSNEVRALRMVPLTLGTNVLLALEPDLHPAPQDTRLVVLKNYTPIEGIMVALKLALYGGLVLAAPFVFFFVGQFVLPALKVTEKAILYRAVGYGTVLFFLGVLCCYFLVAGVALTATVQFSNWMGFIADEWRADAYIGFMCKFMLGMGLTFELPVVILTLVKIELLDLAKLRAFRPYAIIGNLVIAAVVTPSGDPFTMVLMAFPLHLLYELSVGVAWYWEWRARRNNAVATTSPT